MWNGSEIIMQIGIFGLPGVQVEYYKRGLERPVDGDRAKVDVHVSLPCAGGKDDLADEYVFGEKVCLLGAPLNPNWGTVIAKGKRTMIFTAQGDTFEEAFDGAESHIEIEFEQLIEEYYNRKAKLDNINWKP